MLELNGKIISPKGPEFNVTGILVVSSRHILETNMVSASVKYFRLDLDPRSGFDHINDYEFVCPYQYLLDNFQVLHKTKDEEGNDKAVWLNMEEPV